ncbi:MAG: glycine--tRNA ligase subunit beta [Candidatus Saccharibacteria bacterium]
MAKDLLLEIGTEEMPAGFMPEVLAELKKSAETKLNDNRMSYTSVETFGTPRRMALLVEGLAEEQEEATREARGPRLDKAFDEDGKPTKAAEGFARGQGIMVEELVTREVSGVEYVFAYVKEEGRPTADILSGLLMDLILGLGFPKSMRWGYSTVRFARPIRWITALFGSNSIDLQIENVKSSNTTYGHRFLAPGPITLNNPKDYIGSLRDAYVIVDHEVRRLMIWDQVVKAAASVQGKVPGNEELLEEVNFLVEYPTAFLGRFSEDYLEIPPEVLTTSMKEHQRYFPVIAQDGKLMASFIGVRNGTAENIDVVRDGNQRVLKARLEDAYFFYKEDTSEPLASRTELLKNVVYQERLGTVYAKVERLQDLAAFIAGELGYKNIEQVKRAAYLCKADLETGMVYEFPELQGIMGRYYALKDGEDTIVADAVFEHYLPRFAGDDIPKTEPGIALSLAEKLDNLVGSFAIGVKPTGSQDPFALRRQALGIVAIVLGENLDVELVPSIRKSYQEFAAANLDLTEDQVVSELMEFILLRFRGVMQEEGISYDVLDAVLDEPGSSLVLLRDKARALMTFKSQPNVENIMIAFNRPYNLAKKAEHDRIDPDAFVDPAETALYQELQSRGQKAGVLLEAGEYDTYFEVLAGFRPVLDDFFEKIMVMVDDNRVRENRLALLKQAAQVFLNFANFSKLVS